VFAARDAGRYISKYLRPDGAKTSFVPLPEAINRITPRDPDTGRLKVLLRPVYVSPVLTRHTGVTMGYLRYRRWAWRRWGGDWPEQIVQAAYRHHQGVRPLSLRDQEVEAALAARPPTHEAHVPAPRSAQPDARLW